MFDLGKLAFDLVSQLIWGVIQDGLKSSTLSFFKQRKIESRVKDATAEVVEGLVPFLEQEKISSDKQRRLIETCVSELKPFTKKPDELFKGSLDGQKIFENLYRDKELPNVILEDGLKDIYTLLFPRIATLLCKIPAAVQDWENEAWSENYRRFDEVVAQLKTLFAQVDELANAPQKGADKTLTLLKRTLKQKIGLQLDITGLRADQPYSGKFDDFFVLPEIVESTKEKEKKPAVITKSDDCFNTFTKPNCLAVVYGAPGAGKSTWSKWLQKESLNTEWNGTVIRAEFRDLRADNLPSAHELIRKEAGKQLAEDLTSEKIRQWLDNMQIAFILDGFDEVKPTDRKDLIEWIEELAEAAKGCSFILTSRPLTTDHLEKLREDWSIWNIEQFDKPRIITYISKWYTNTPLLNDSNRDIDAEDLATKWSGDPTIGPLTGNPLLLSTLLMVHHLDGNLPNGRSNLYKRYVDGMLGIWDERHKLVATDVQLSLDEKRKVIQGIALRLFLLEQETMDENILLEWLHGFLPKINIKASAKDTLLVLRERSGLIIGPGIYSFAHKTIMEFLIAEAILQGDQQDNMGNSIDRFYLFEHQKDDRWNTVLFLWAGMAAFTDVNSFVGACLKTKNWALAFGLLLDQYQRFPLDNRRKLLLNLKEIRKWDGNYGWFYTGNPQNNGGIVSIDRPTIKIRKLFSSRRLFVPGGIEDLFRQAIQDESITWQDFADAKGKAYEWAWGMFAVTPPKNPKLWRDVLESRIPTSDLASRWKSLIAAWVFNFNHFHTLSLDVLDQYVSIYKHAFPDYSGYLSLVLMNITVELANDSEITTSQKQDVNLFYSRSTRYIVEQNANEIIPFLDDAKNWTIESPVENIKSVEGDLLKLYIRSINELIQKGALDIEADKKEEVEQYIKTLIKLRKKKNRRVFTK